MPGADLILFVSGSVGATALVLWIVFRRSRVRSEFAVAPAHAARLATVLPVTGHDDIGAIPEPADTVARDCPDDRTTLVGAAPTAEATPAGPGAPEGNKHFASANAAKPGAAAQLVDRSPEDAPMPPASHEEGDAYASEAAATAHTADDSAGITDGPPAANEEAALGEADQALLAVEDHEELPDFTTAVVGNEQTTPPRSESVGAEASNNGSLDSGGHLLPSPPEEIPAVQDDGHLADAIGDADSRISPAATSFGKVLTAPDAPCDATAELDRDSEEPSAQEPSQPCSGVSAERLPEPAAAADDLESEDLEPDPAAHAGSETEQTSGPEEEARPDAVPASRPRPSKPAQHRDRRGQRRPAQAKTAAASGEGPPATEVVLRTPAEAKLRLMIHPVRRTVSISAVLTRPAGYPDNIELLLGHGTEVGAYGEDRYDDVDLDWTPNLLAGEVRLDSSEGYQWLRSAPPHSYLQRAGGRARADVGWRRVPELIKCDRLHTG